MNRNRTQTILCNLTLAFCVLQIEKLKQQLVETKEKAKEEKEKLVSIYIY